MSINRESEVSEDMQGESEMRKELRECLEQMDNLERQNATQVDKLIEAENAEAQHKLRIELLITAAAEHSKQTEVLEQKNQELEDRLAESRGEKEID
jgi:hypothetical protein